MRIDQAKQSIAESRQSGAATVLAHYTQLDTDQLNYYAHKASQGDKRALERVIMSTLAFVHKRASKIFVGKSGLLGPSVSYDDAFQAGICGVIHACSKYDISKGFAFTTYVDSWIRMKVARELNRHTSPLKLTEKQVIDGQAKDSMHDQVLRLDQHIDFSGGEGQRWVDVISSDTAKML